MTASSEERMLPLVRATVAKRLLQMGFKAKQVSRILNVTPAAVTQYSKGVRGKRTVEFEHQKQLIDALADKCAQRINANMDPVGTVELLDVAHQILAVTSRQKAPSAESKDGKTGQFITILKERLQLELEAAQKCLNLANRAREDHTRLLLRMVASDSIRHADIVSQIASWLETGHDLPSEGPDQELLAEILAIEDNANELSLRKTITTEHRVAQLLLESIDMDEEKHERLIGKLAERSP